MGNSAWGLERQQPLKGSRFHHPRKVTSRIVRTTTLHESMVLFFFDGQKPVAKNPLSWLAHNLIGHNRLRVHFTRQKTRKFGHKPKKHPFTLHPQVLIYTYKYVYYIYNLYSYRGRVNYVTPSSEPRIKNGREKGVVLASGGHIVIKEASQWCKSLQVLSSIGTGWGCDKRWDDRRSEVQPTRPLSDKWSPSETQWWDYQWNRGHCGASKGGIHAVLISKPAL